MNDKEKEEQILKTTTLYQLRELRKAVLELIEALVDAFRPKENKQ